MINLTKCHVVCEKLAVSFYILKSSVADSMKCAIYSKSKFVLR